MTASDQEWRKKLPIDPGKLVLELLWLIIVAVPLIVWSIIQKFLLVNKKSLQGETVLITGAGNGLGREVAFRMAAKGCKLALVDINEDSVTQVAKEINQIHENVARSYVANLGKPEDIKKLSQQITSDFERVDILVNNAGVVYGGGSILAGKDLDVEAMFQINVISHFRMIREFLGGMLKRNHGHIVAISSSSSYTGLANAAVYTSTKWAINGMMETVRDELRAIPNNQVKVSIASPYFIATNKEYVGCWDLRFPPISVDEAAEELIEGIEREDDEFTIPSHLYMLLSLLKMLPRNLKDMVLSVVYARVKTHSVEKMNAQYNTKIIDSLEEKIKSS